MATKKRGTRGRDKEKGVGTRSIRSVDDDRARSEFSSGEDDDRAGSGRNGEDDRASSRRDEGDDDRAGSRSRSIGESTGAKGAKRRRKARGNA